MLVSIKGYQHTRAEMAQQLPNLMLVMTDAVLCVWHQRKPFL